MVFFDPPIFSAENTQTTKKIMSDIPTAYNHHQKNL